MSSEADGSFAYFGDVAFAKCDTEASVRNGVGIKMDYTRTEMLLAALSPRPTPRAVGLAWHLCRFDCLNWFWF